ncbi:MAG: class flavin-dependent oxidoreductase, partial [Microbacterium sp.]|nr:class flavin-dependent oxidoreductase [Microbacterium sp.]
LAGRTADAVFTLGGGSLESGRALYDDYKQRAIGAGRRADDLKVLPWFSPIIGDTEAEAEERFRELAGLTPERVQVDLLGHYLGTDLGERDVDEPFVFDFDLEGFNQSKSGYQAIAALLAQRSYTIRELAWEVLRRRFTLGTPDTLAAHLVERYEHGAADGFILMSPTLPDTLERFVDDIVPRLTDRGIYPAEYTGDTLRDHLGLARPAGRYAA